MTVLVDLVDIRLGRGIFNLGLCLISAATTASIGNDMWPVGSVLLTGSPSTYT